MKSLLTLTFCLGIAGFPAFSGSPEILDVTVTRSGMDWRFSVSMQHEDTGWDHFADAWQVLDANGNLLAERELMHPHVNEQPFTRSLGGIMLPDGTREVFIRARCSADGFSDILYRVALPTYQP